MIQFNATRFGRVLRWEFYANCHSYLRNTLAMSGAMAFFYIVNQISWEKSQYMLDFQRDTFAQMYVSGQTGITLTVAMAVGFFLMANVFKPFRHKRQRIGLLMLPASNLEKFVARVLAVTLSIVAMLTVAFSVADLAQYLASYIIRTPFHTFIMGNLMAYLHEAFVTRSLIEVNGTPVCFDIGVLLWPLLLLQHSFLLLCGTFFRRNAAACTVFVYILVGTLLFSGGIYGGFYIDDHFDNTQTQLTQGLANVLVYGGACLLTALSMLFYRLAYVLFRRFQVINNRVINI